MNGIPTAGQHDLVSKPKQGGEGTHVAVGDGLDAESQSAKHITEHLRRSREGWWT